MPDHFLETTNLRIREIETGIDAVDKKVENLSEKLAEMDKATGAQFVETRELIHDRFTILQHRLESVDAGIRTDMHEGFRRVRTEMQDGFAAVRTELQDGLTGVRTELQDGLETIRTEMSKGHSRVDGRFDRLETKLDRVLATRPARTRGRRRR